MGRQRGLVHISGQFGDVQYYLDGNQGYARMMTPVSKEQIKHDPAYELVRKNNSEFSCAIHVMNALADCIGVECWSFAERFFRPRLQGKIHSRVRKGPGKNGERKFEVASNLDFFRGIHLDASDKFDSRFLGRHSVAVNADRNTATLSVAPFHTRNLVKVPGGATHFRMLLSVGVLTDFAFAVDCYVSSQPSLVGRGDGACTADMACDGRMNPGFQLSVAVPGLPVLPVDACLVVSLGIEFLRVIGGEVDVLASGRAMKVFGAY